jgi:hypothetical protein
MRRIGFVSIAFMPALLWLEAPLRAQGTVSSFHIASSINGGVKFKVDGKTYIDAATFLWPQGSKHIVEFTVEDDGFQYRDGRGTRYSSSRDSATLPPRFLPHAAPRGPPFPMSSAPGWFISTPPATGIAASSG